MENTTKEIVYVNPKQLRLVFKKTPKELEEWLFKGVDKSEWYAIRFFYAMAIARLVYENLPELNGGTFDWDNPDIEVPVPVEFPGRMIYEIDCTKNRIDAFYRSGEGLYLVTPEE